MAIDHSLDTDEATIPQALRRFLKKRTSEAFGLVLFIVIFAVSLAMASWSVNDPSWSHSTAARPVNWLGAPGAYISAELMQLFGLAAMMFVLIPLAWALRFLRSEGFESWKSALTHWLVTSIAFATALGALNKAEAWPLASGMGGSSGEIIASILLSLMAIVIKGTIAKSIVFIAAAIVAWWSLPRALCLTHADIIATLKGFVPKSLPSLGFSIPKIAMPKLKKPTLPKMPAFSAKKKVDEAADEQEEEATGGDDVISRFAPLKLKKRIMPTLDAPSAPIQEFSEPELLEEDSEDADEEVEVQEEVEEAPAKKRVTKLAPKVKPKAKSKFELPDLDLLSTPKKVGRVPELSKDQLEENARALEGVLDDFGVKGQIIAVRPGPVVTLYELEPAPGIKSSRVISLADDIARSMSAVSARVAVVQGRNAIGIELPNSKRETVFLRELFENDSFAKDVTTLNMALGKNIGGDPVFANLAKMPHLLIAGTTGSGKSVGINTMILSLLYRLPPDKCKLIMIDPKMLELSVYEGIPHLLAPVVTDPRKAVVALKWAVREMEDRYKKMSKCGVRNVDGYNAKITQLSAKGEKMSRTVQTGFDAETGEPIFEQEEMELAPMPYIVVIIDEMADLMMVAGKDIEGAVQRLAQMARAAGIHVVMATQRPSVDVITGTIKANFPTRISFQVTSKIDSRTILGEQGAEQLLGQGDMLYMAGGGRISRLHGPFVSDTEVEAIVNHLKAQGSPEYLEAVTEEEEEGEGGEAGAIPGAPGGSGDDLYDQAVQVVLRDKKVSTSYVQRRLGVGYNKAATLIERMEQEGVISAPNGQGKREILVPGDSARA